MKIKHSFKKLEERISLLNIYFDKGDKNNNIISKEIFIINFIKTWNDSESCLNSFRKLDKIKEDKIMLNIKWGLWKFVTKYFQENEDIKESKVSTIFCNFSDESDLFEIFKGIDTKLIRKDILWVD